VRLLLRLWLRLRLLLLTCNLLLLLTCNLLLLLLLLLLLTCNLLLLPLRLLLLLLLSARWVKKASTCPVCRKDLNGDEAPTSATPGQPRAPCSTTTTDRQQQQQQGGQLWRRRGPGAWAPADPQWAMAEQMFRLRRLHMMYPDYVTM
jgi:hypothetical protein